jgi:peptidoglycan/xylan/chitin deacetylase (PgdA/CDA1 family)
MFFEEQLDVLRRTRYPLSLTDFVRYNIAGTLPPDAVALTFDDGYVDNLAAGKPRLAAADVPATVFLATGFLDRPGEFWWDELARLILLENGPRNIELVIRGESVRINLGIEPAVLEQSVISAALLKRRQNALTTIWQAIRCLEDEERQLVMAELRSLFVRGSRAGQGRAMTRKEVRALASDGLVAIGAHTVTHPVLSKLGAAACHREIAESKSDCEQLIGAPVTGFAYPYGDFDAKARGAVVAAGFVYACSTRHEPTSGASDIFALPRIHVRNWNGDAFEQVLRQCSTIG